MHSLLAAAIIEESPFMSSDCNEEGKVQHLLALLFMPPHTHGHSISGIYCEASLFTIRSFAANCASSIQKNHWWDPREVFGSHMIVKNRSRQHANLLHEIGLQNKAPTIKQCRFSSLLDEDEREVE